MKIVFIGNRYRVLDYLITNFNYNIEVYVQKNSYLHNYIREIEINYKVFSLGDKDKIINEISSLSPDILVSNGCPFILPKLQCIMLNIHPTFLPYLRGKTPLNGVFFNEVDFIGATMHYISSEIDGGNIIYQEKHKISSDIDQGLIYYLSFYLEKVVFEKGWQILIKSRFKYEGKKNCIEDGTYFNRTKKKRLIDFNNMKTSEIIKIVRSFGIKSQGAIVKDVDNLSKIYEATIINNSLLKKIFKNNESGEILLRYDEKLLIKTLDGIIKVTRFE